MTTDVTEKWIPESGLDVLLVLLYADDGKRVHAPIEGITRLDKLMFLLSKTEEFGGLFEDDYEFTPYNFGPYATELLDDIEALEEEGLLTSKSVGPPQGATETRDAEIIEEETGEAEVRWDMYPFQSYRLTKDGKSIIKKLYDCLTEKQKSKLHEIKKSFNRLPLTSLLKYVYEEYPKSASESLIRDRILR
jgi:uncharacterized protein YwgA